MTCEQCLPLALDLAHDLLDPPEAQAVREHLEACPTCTAAQARETGMIRLAAKSEFPNITFDPYRDVTTPKLATPNPVRATVLRWAIAASLLLTTTALLGRGVPDSIAKAVYHRDVVQAHEDLMQSEVELARVQKKIDSEREVFQNALEQAKKNHDTVAQEWITAESKAMEAQRARPFVLEVDGPSHAIVGATNEYTIRSPSPKSTISQPVDISASLQTSDGKTLIEQKFPKTRDASFKVPASVWARVPAGAELNLHVSAAKPGEATASVSEKIRLSQPLYTTLLNTDRPIYRPGETLFFRSLTLNRVTFRPPTQDLHFRYLLIAPNGQMVQDLSGMTRLTTDGVAPVLGPDSEPLRGIASGMFQLPVGLVGGEYKLRVVDAQAYSLDSAAPSLAERTLIINTYTPDVLEKTLDFGASSYGPGETVRAKLRVTSKDKPAAGASLTIEAIAVVNQNDNKTLPLQKFDAKTNADGTASIEFDLPKMSTQSASLSIKVSTKGIVETILRPVPLTTKELRVEFFPEGGELVGGVPNRVYFRVTKPNGKPADFVGLLSDGKTALKTLTDKDNPGVNQGLGVFTFTPEKGKNYHATATQPAGLEMPTIDATTRGYVLPNTRDTGVVMTIPQGVSKPGQPIVVELQAVGAKKKVVVGAYIRGETVATTQAELVPGKSQTITLDPKASQVGGVVRVTVFEVTGDDVLPVWKPIVERLVFRTPNERLLLSASTPKTNNLFPGEKVEVTVNSKDETGKPKPAVLMAAVVNRSTITMVDDRTLRQLPTHFLLSGELQKPETLENADFLLTDHPLAPTTLDLVLGTQGWRRFAEQAPELFRRSQPSDDAVALLTAMGASNRPILRGTDVSLRVREEFWPKYEAAVEKLDRSELRLNDREYLRPFNPELVEWRNQSGRASATLQNDGGEYLPFAQSSETRSSRLPWTLLALSAVTVFCFICRYLLRGDYFSRRWLTIGGLGFAFLTLLTLLLALLSRPNETSWMAHAHDRENGRYLTKSAAPIGPSGPSGPGWKPPRIGLPKVSGMQARQGMPALPLGPVMEVKGQTLEELRGQVRVGSPAIRFQNQAAANSTSPSRMASYNRVSAQLPMQSMLVVREYAHVYTEPKGDGTGSSKDLTETLVWKPAIVVPETGEVKFAFDLSEQIGVYQVLVAGHTLDGRLGSTTTSFTVTKPLSLRVKMPMEVTDNDKAIAQATITSTHNEPLNVTLSGQHISPAQHQFELLANGNVRKSLPIDGLPAGEHTVRIDVRGNAALQDGHSQKLSVIPEGFPVSGSVTQEVRNSGTFKFKLPDTIFGTLKAELVVYPNPVADLQASLAGLLREPTGCFEQTSTTNYPNVLILDYLIKTRNQNPTAESRAKEFLASGYQRLTSFECPKTGEKERIGFEWFGEKDKQHEALTAFGLVQFTDMSRVYPVDAALLVRTKKYLLSLRDGQGGFTRTDRRLDSFGRSPASTTNAYITWAISESEATSTSKTDLTQELKALTKLATSLTAPEAQDAYFVALVANALLNTNAREEAKPLLKKLQTWQLETGKVKNGKTSITLSEGVSLDIETTAFTTLAWMKNNPAADYDLSTQKAIAWIMSVRSPSGTFGATQSTIMALKAILKYAEANPKAKESCTLIYRMPNSYQSGTTDFSNTAQTPVVIPIGEEWFNEGDNTLNVSVVANESYPITLRWTARTEKPTNDDNAPLTLTTKLSKEIVNEGDPVRLQATISNTTDQQQGMVTTILGLPAGLKVPDDMKQLRTLTEPRQAGQEPLVSYFEIRGRELILYRRGMAAKETLSLAIDLIAEYAGEYKGPASRIYPYYNPEAKFWADPLNIVVQEK
ncbi:MAG: alpha-2-macroglobulin family protein [Fimbriiglobus sp.]